MKVDGTGLAAAGLFAGLALGFGWSAPASAQMEQSEAIYRQNALGHADAVVRAYRRLEEHIREESTAATDGAAWPNSVPPAATGWLADWTVRGVRARYCDDTLLVYLEPAQLKGVGADHRAVQVALRLYVPGRDRGATGPGLHWLESGAVTQVGGTAVVPLPACISAPGALPSGRAAFAGPVRDPFETANLRQRRGTEAMDPPQACAAGEHGTGRRMFRDVVETLNDRNEVVGAPVYGPWQVLVDGCRADYTVTERFTRTCTFQAGPPHNRQLTGIEVWERTKTVTQGGDVYGPAQFVSTSCWGSDGTGAAPVNAAVSVTVVGQEYRQVGCPPGESGHVYQERDVLSRTAQFPWDATPIVTEGRGPWRETGRNCHVPPPGSDPQQSAANPNGGGWICAFGVQCGGYGWLANNAWNNANSWAQVGDRVTVNACGRCGTDSSYQMEATPHGWLRVGHDDQPMMPPADDRGGNPGPGLDPYYVQYHDREENPAIYTGSG